MSFLSRFNIFAGILLSSIDLKEHNSNSDMTWFTITGISLHYFSIYFFHLVLLQVHLLLVHCTYFPLAHSKMVELMRKVEKCYCL